MVHQKSPHVLCVTQRLRNTELIDPSFQWHGPKGKVISGRPWFPLATLTDMSEIHKSKRTSVSHIHLSVSALLFPVVSFGSCRRCAHFSQALNLDTDITVGEVL